MEDVILLITLLIVGIVLNHGGAHPPIQVLGSILFFGALIAIVVKLLS